MEVIVKNSRVLKTLFICFAVFLLIYCHTISPAFFKVELLSKDIQLNLTEFGWVVFLVQSCRYDNLGASYTSEKLT